MLTNHTNMNEALTVKASGVPGVAIIHANQTPAKPTSGLLGEFVFFLFHSCPRKSIFALFIYFYLETLLII